MVYRTDLHTFLLFLPTSTHLFTALSHTKKHLNRGAFFISFCGENEDLSPFSCHRQELGSHTALKCVKLACKHQKRYLRLANTPFAHLKRGAFLYLSSGYNEDLSPFSCHRQELGSHTALKCVKLACKHQKRYLRLANTPFAHLNRGAFLFLFAARMRI